MIIEIAGSGTFVLKEVYEPIVLVTKEGIEFYICMRDNGFEMGFVHEGDAFVADVEESTIKKL